MKLTRQSGAQILLFIRDGKANTWKDLCEEFGLAPDRHDTRHYWLREQLEALKEVGLIEFKSERKEGRIEGAIRVADSWERIQRVLGISLAQIARLDTEALVVRPFFGRPDGGEQKHDLFVLMPFFEPLRPVYEDHIKKISRELKLSVARADDFFSAHSVMADVWSGIFFARAVIADCTGRNPNVFYEIGLAHVLGKPVILITQNADDVPFDVRHIRFIHYTFTPRGMVDFERALGETIRNILP